MQAARPAHVGRRGERARRLRRAARRSLRLRAPRARAPAARSLSAAQQTITPIRNKENHIYGKPSEWFKGYKKTSYEYVAKFEFSS